MASDTVTPTRVKHLGKVIVHLGAHRTATTLLQQTLAEHAEQLLSDGLDLLVPPKTRRQVFDGLIKRPSTRSTEDEETAAHSARKLRNRFRKFQQDKELSLFVSEENILGTMRECRDSCTKYPELRERLSPYAEAFSHVDELILGIRNSHHWWCSVLAYTVGEYASLPTQPEIDQIVASKRTWSDVISDIQSCFPDTKLTVREHPYNPNRIGPDLADQTGIETFNQIKSVDRVSNKSSSEDALRRKLAERGEQSEGLTSMMPGGVFDPFSAAQRETLETAYRKDMDKVQAVIKDGRRFHPSIQSIRSRTSKDKAERGQAPICLLHIGKTGGSFLRAALSGVPEKPSNLHILKHDATLESTRRRYGDDRKIAFVIREPKDRFVSAFNSRLRQGRPAYNSPWSAAEASAFHWFEDPNSLAEALGSKNERMKSAAFFAMSSIQHLKLNYQHFLTSVEALDREKKNVQLCIDLSDLDGNLTSVYRALGLNTVPKASEENRHKAPQIATPLSELAQRNLHEFWKNEFEIYNFCKSELTLTRS